MRLFAKFLRWGLLLLFAAAGVWYLRGNLEEIRALRLRLDRMHWVFASAVAIYVLRGQLLHTLLAPAGILLTRAEQLGLTVLPTLANNLLPANPGLLFKAGYLRKRHRVQWESIASLFVISWIAVTIAHCFWGLWAVVALDGSFVGLAALFAGLTVAGMLAIRSDWPERWLDRLRPGGNYRKWFSALRLEKRALLHVTVLGSLQVAASGAMAWACAQALSVELDIATCLALGSVRHLSTLLVITPGALGVSELTVASFTVYLGLGEHIGVFVALLTRTAMFASGLAMAPFLYWAMRTPVPLEKTD